MTRLDRTFRTLRSRPRALAAIGVAVAVVLSIPAQSAQLVTRVLVGWNAGVAVYVALTLWMMSRSTREAMLRRAEQLDDGQFVVLGLVAMAAVMSLWAIVAELGVAKDLRGTLKLAHVILTLMTLIGSWTLIHLVFALHYAHDFYEEQRVGHDGGIAFPGTGAPRYVDFAYVAFVIGTSGQTADVSFTTTTMRKVALLHCVLAFAFNTALLGLTINLAASLL